MKNFRIFLFENFQFLEVKFSIYLNRRVFVMMSINLMCYFVFQCLVIKPLSSNFDSCMRTMFTFHVWKNKTN